MATISRLSVSLTANPQGFNRGFQKAELTLQNFQRGIGRRVAAISGVLAGIGLGVLGRDLINVNEKFQNLKSSLLTVTGSAEAADTAFSNIEKFALNTPFNLDQVVESFIKLKALGLDPSERALESYGNTASAMGKSLNQVIEAVADASVGEFERLKEFGIKAKSQGDQVTFTFQNVATTVGKNAEEIQGYLLAIGENQFGGAMENQMKKNLTPAFSNFRAAIESLQVAIGEAGLNDMIVQLVTSTTAWVNTLDSVKIQNFINAMKVIGDAFMFLFRILEPVAELIGTIGAVFSIGNLPGQGQIGQGVSGYQLGQFNDRDERLERLQHLLQGTGEGQIEEQKTTNEILQGISERIQFGQGAVAG